MLCPVCSGAILYYLASDVVVCNTMHLWLYVMILCFFPWSTFASLVAAVQTKVLHIRHQTVCNLLSLSMIQQANTKTE